MDEILGQVLRNAVWERLDLLNDLAERADEQSVLSVARSELPRLTEGWRALLAAHEPDERGMCPQCSRRFRPMRSPCSVWRAAYEHLVGGALAPQARQVSEAAREDAAGAAVKTSGPKNSGPKNSGAKNGVTRNEFPDPGAPRIAPAV